LARHKSAQKRARQDVKRRERNRTIRTRTRSVVKTLRSELEANAAGAAEKLREAESALRKAATKGVIPKRRASRQVSRLAKAANRAARSSSASQSLYTRPIADGGTVPFVRVGGAARVSPRLEPPS